MTQYDLHLTAPICQSHVADLISSSLLAGLAGESIATMFQCFSSVGSTIHLAQPSNTGTYRSTIHISIFSLAHNYDHVLIFRIRFLKLISLAATHGVIGINRNSMSSWKVGTPQASARLSAEQLAGCLKLALDLIVGQDHAAIVNRRTREHSIF